jgi:serine/threonine protein kinase
MGVVYKARQVRADRVVALKVILAGHHAGPSERERFRAEAQAVARLQHPGVVQIYEVGEHDGLPFYSMEFCPGGSLADHLDGTPLPPAEAARLVERLAGAIQACHEQRIVHRDLKPGNILLSLSRNPEGSASDALPCGSRLNEAVPKVSDFGLAKDLDGSRRTASNAIVGTPSYMAPEQAGRTTRDIGPAADVYALGAILYELLSGRPPFKGPTVVDTVLQLLHEDPVPPRQLQPGVPRDLEAVCLKCLQKEPGRRYASARELADDLARFARGEPVRTRPLSRSARAGRWCRRHPAVAALVALVATTLLAGTATTAYFAVQADQAAEAARAALRETEQAKERQRTTAVRVVQWLQVHPEVARLSPKEVALRFLRDNPDLSGRDLDDLANRTPPPLEQPSPTGAEPAPSPAMGPEAGRIASGGAGLFAPNMIGD